jgi:hypothetical protein
LGNSPWGFESLQPHGSLVVEDDDVDSGAAGASREGGALVWPRSEIVERERH